MSSFQNILIPRSTWLQYTSCCFLFQDRGKQRIIFHLSAGQVTNTKCKCRAHDVVQH